jgi:hypothetical protein
MAKQQGEPENAKTADPATAPPPIEDVTIRAYDLLKNPYAHQGRRVMLDVASYPIFLMDNFDRYEKYPPDTEAARRAGWIGLDFNRMIAEGVALYDVRGWNIKLGPRDVGSPLTDIGQLLVLLSNRTAQPPSTIGGQWVVECLGPKEGTNAIGGTISVPAVRFWGGPDVAKAEAAALQQRKEAQPPDSDHRQAPDSGEYGRSMPPSVPAADLTTVTVYDLLKNPYGPNGQRVLLDVLSYPLLQDSRFVQYREPQGPAARALGLYGLKFNRMVAEDAALYDARGAELGASVMKNIGQVIVVIVKGGQVPNVEDGRWVVERLGAREGTNYLGAPISVPVVRFLRTSLVQAVVRAMEFVK